MTRRILIVLATLVLLAAACGDDSGGGASDDTATDDDIGADDDTPADDDIGADDEGSGADDAGDDDFVEDLVEDLEGQQAAEGGGSATLVVGDQEWTFTSVLCAIGEDQTGQEGAEFNLSSIEDGMQMYAAIDSFGHSVSLDDITDFENPSVSLSSDSSSTVITIDGKNISAEAEFRDGTSDGFETTPGTFTATCP